jgi:RNA polymerase sigma factor (sigma-70 family)
MSPLPLRRYRAERLLREQFERQRRNVVGGVAARLRAVGVQLDERDLEACYAQAWQGLYAAVLEGEQIASPDAWLALVTYRRALDEHRARIRIARLALDSTHENDAAGHGGGERALAVERDRADELDDRLRLRQLFEGLRARLNEREQQAATLCYLQGLSRAEAAERMGVSQTRMRKLMEGRSGGAPGVAGKVGALVETIGAGRWCEQQSSLMRAFAYGILDPAGERYELAELHHSECPACRAYVLSLRGLAAVLPPLPSTLVLLLGSGAAGGAAGSAATGVGGAAPAGSALATSTLSASGAAGAGAVGGGGWWLAGSLGAKLAAGCLLALGVGAGCVALGVHPDDRGAGGHRHRHASVSVRSNVRERSSGVATGTAASEAIARESGATVRTQSAAAPVAPSAQAAREFGPEQAAGAAGAGSGGATGAGRAVARAASVHPASTSGEPAATSTKASAAADSERTASGGVSAAEREFAPG